MHCPSLSFLLTPLRLHGSQLSAARSIPTLHTIPPIHCSIVVPRRIRQHTPLLQNMSGLPPAAPAGAPMKVPMKVPMKFVPKVPVAPATGKVPVPAVPRPAVVAPVTPRPAVVAPVKTASPVKVAAKRARSPSPSSSSSSSSEASSSEEEDDDDEENVTLFGFAKKNDLVVSTFKDEDLEAPMELGHPVQPPKQRVSSDIDADIRKLLDSIAKAETNMQIKEDTKTVSLGTSKTNYIDPRIVYSFAKRVDVDVKRLLSATLSDKFQWAHSADADYQF